MGASSTGRTANTVDHDQAALDERIDDIIAMHDGDWRAALETLLIVADARAETISFGYVRGRAPGLPLSSD
ncbi:hypothetical protein SAMN02745157_0735 [Kaistia soli DSM 19436]|uniref:Uncharacterized protein n=1 Tax=Kaistia soli DSM 19436 TaxID=1122133 RepID=A0A1M4VLL5_9HYPH|nr:hypothetical protein [Kaistia soli]SHE69722.1 hypothetical protein SAMN02745157_0735 [Kaistia soli DSM 19436]